MGTGLPWDWRLGPSDSSERAHWLEMLSSLASTALFVADAGFVGYEYAQTVISAGHHVLVRVGANVRLLKRLGCVEERDGLVYLWPEKAATLCDLLNEAVIDNYAPGDKTSRGYPRKKKEKPPGAPQIFNATPQQRSRAKEMKTAA